MINNKLLDIESEIDNSYGTSQTKGYSQNYLNSRLHGISDVVGSSTTDGYSQNYINNNIPLMKDEYGSSLFHGYSQDYANEHFGGTTLYNNASGNNSSVTLSETSANFIYLEIFFRANDGNDYTSYTKVYSPNGKKTYLRYEIKSGGTLYTKIVKASISGNKITLSDGIEYYFYCSGSGNTINASSSSNIYITRVVGYK